MADTAEPTNTPGEPPKPAGESHDATTSDVPTSDVPRTDAPTTDGPATDAPANAAPANEDPVTNPPASEPPAPAPATATATEPPSDHTPIPESSAPMEPMESMQSMESMDSFDTTLPPIDKSLPAVDSSLPSFDHSLPPMDPSIPHLPSIESTLPPLDPDIPAIEGSDENFFSNHKSNGFDSMDHDGFAALQAHTESDNHHHEGTGLHTTDGSHQGTPNGSHMQHGQSPAAQGQNSAQQPPNFQQHQFSQPAPQQSPQASHQYASPQPQSQQYQQHTPEGYQSHQGTPNQGASSHVPQAPIGSPMPPMSTVSQYMSGYPNNVSQMGMNPNAQMRYQLPGDPNKMLSSGRHKKEVKRRTKTGCLTCRKRRIKCDEGHPVCRNCVKSKRECLGYDPVFKQQPTPSAIQPAPNPHPSLVVNPQDPSGSTTPTPTSSYPAAPPGYVPAVSQPFAPSESPSTSTEQYNYGASIDPSLDGNQSSNMASVQSAAEALQPTINPASTTGAPTDSTTFKVKQVQISDLLALRGIPPPPPHPITALPPNRLEEIQAVYLATYAPAIDKFFETRWFSEKGLTHLLANAQLMAEYSALIDAFNDRNLSDPNVLARLESFEASVVWSSMTLCRHVMNVSNGNPEYDLLASSKRLDVIEAMITGEHLETNPVAHFPPREPAANPPSLADQGAQRSLDFWSCIGHFLTLHDNEASSAKEIDDTLGRCRTLLDTFENRDVIYSVAIARHLGQRWADFPRSFPQPITTNEKDSGAKLYVAQKFLESEAGGKGTTQVIKRICGMVVRSWIVSRE